MSEETSETANAAPDQAGNSEEDKPQSNIGRIEWIDLTVDDASRVKDFYCSVIGWSSAEVDMGSYSDFNINLPASNDTIAGVCHARGGNANLPSQWLVYVRVASVDESASQCKKSGGKIVDGPRRMGGSNFCVIQDPAGAVLALLSD